MKENEIQIDYVPYLWMIPFYALFLLALLFFGCNPHFSSGSTDRDGGVDSGAVDASGGDSDSDSDGSEEDAGPKPDPDCPNPASPQDCEEGDAYCWPPEVDCDTTLFTCGTSVARCIDATAYAACCDGDFFVCGIAYPWYCYADGRCYRAEEDCPSDPDAGYVCEFRGEPCS